MQTQASLDKQFMKQKQDQNFSNSNLATFLCTLETIYEKYQIKHGKNRARTIFGYYDVNDFKNTKKDGELKSQAEIQFLIFQASYLVYIETYKTDYEFPRNLSKTQLIQFLEEWAKADDNFNICKEFIQMLLENHKLSEQKSLNYLQKKYERPSENTHYSGSCKDNQRDEERNEKHSYPEAGSNTKEKYNSRTKNHKNNEQTSCNKNRGCSHIKCENQPSSQYYGNIELRKSDNRDKKNNDMYKCGKLPVTALLVGIPGVCAESDRIKETVERAIINTGDYEINLNIERECTENPMQQSIVHSYNIMGKNEEQIIEGLRREDENQNKMQDSNKMTVDEFHNHYSL